MERVAQVWLWLLIWTWWRLRNETSTKDELALVKASRSIVFSVCFVFLSNRKRTWLSLARSLMNENKCCLQVLFTLCCKLTRIHTTHIHA